MRKQQVVYKGGGSHQWALVQEGVRALLEQDSGGPVMTK